MSFTANANTPTTPTKDDKVARVAVVGCGAWTQGWHLPNLANRKDVKIVCLVDPSDQPGVGYNGDCESMSALCAKYGAPRHTSIQAALADSTLELDGVLVAVPHIYHYEVGMAVINAGLHLLMEKPMTADVKEARALFDFSRERPTQAFLLNNTANWAEGSVAAFEAVSVGKIGTVRLVNCVFAAPLAWMFEGDAHTLWTKPSGSMKGNGFGWGQFAHTFAWVFKVTGLTPKKVYAVCGTSEITGADLFDSLTITCTNGATINASGVGACPDKGFKVVGNWIFGTEGMLNYSGLAGSDNVKHADTENPETGDKSEEKSRAKQETTRPRLEIWGNDGTHEVGPRVEFEHLDQSGTGPGSLHAFVSACRGLPYYYGAGVVEGLKSVCTIDAMYRSALSGMPELVVGCEGC